MSQQLIVTSDFIGGYFLCSSNTRASDTFARIFEWSSYQPALFVLVNLVYTYLVTLTPVLETGMID